MRRALFIFVGLLCLSVSLSCSVGELVVEVPTRTPTPFMTLRPTYTFTPNWTPTFTRTPTPYPSMTATPTLTPTGTLTPTAGIEDKPTEPPAEAATEKPAVAQAPAPPTDTPTPAATDTPTPEPFPFQVVHYVHDTGSPGETRMTAWIRVDYGQASGKYKTLADFQMKVIAPDGQEYLSEKSGPGTADSTAPGTGDNHRMNTKLEIRPYTPGTYTIYLLEGETQMSREFEVTLSAEPRQYVHFEFFKIE